MGQEFHRCFKLAEGWSYNPLSSYPRNDPCFCGSLKKSKKCCLNRIPKAIPQELAKQMHGKSVGSQTSILINYLQSQAKNKNVGSEQDDGHQAQDITSGISPTE